MFLETCAISSPQFIDYTEGENDERKANSDCSLQFKSLSYVDLSRDMGRDNGKVEPSLRSGRVLKFGGTSVGEMQSLGHVLDIITKEANNNNELLVVIVSAPGPTTDWLIDASTLATSGDLDGALDIVDKIADLCIHNAFSASNGTSIAPPVRHLLVGLKKLLEGVSLTRECTPRALDMILSFGERLSALMMGWLLSWRDISRGVAVVDSRKWVITGKEFGHAKVHVSDSYAALRKLRPSWGNRIAVMTGFIGRTRDGGYTTTLGRNGSDFTATLAGAGLNASIVVINTDVKGVHTADPGIVPTAVPVKKLSYELCLELAIYSSARLFHPRTMLPLISSDIPMAIRSTQDIYGPCTMICNDELFNVEGDGIDPTCVTSLEHQSILELHSRMEEGNDSLSRRFLRALETSSVGVPLGIHAAHGQSFSAMVSNDNLKIAKAAVLKEFSADFTAMEVNPLVVKEDVTMLSIVINSLMEKKGVAWKFFDALSGKDIACAHMATGPRSLSCVIDAKDTEPAVRAVHDAFHFSRQLSLVVLCDPDDKDSVAMEKLLDLLRLRGAVVEELDIVVVGMVKVVTHQDQAKSSYHESGGGSCDEEQSDITLTRFDCLYCPEGIVDLSSRPETQKPKNNATISSKDEMNGHSNGIEDEMNGHSNGTRNGIVSVMSARELLECVSKLPLPVFVDCRNTLRGDGLLDTMYTSIGRRPIVWKRVLEFISDVANNNAILMAALELGINVISSHAFSALQLLSQPAMLGRCMCESSRMGAAHLMCNTAISRSALPILQILRGVLKSGVTPLRMEICFGGGLGTILQRCDIDTTLSQNNAADERYGIVQQQRERLSTASFRQPLPVPVSSLVHEFSGTSQR